MEVNKTENMEPVTEIQVQEEPVTTVIEPTPVEVPVEAPSEPVPTEVPTEAPSEVPTTPVAPITPEPNKKGKGGLGIILILIALAVIGGGIFLAYNNGLFGKKDQNNGNEVDKDKDNDKDKKPEQKKYEEETLTRESDVVQKLYRIFSETEYPGNYEEATEAYKKRVILNLLEESDYTKKTCGDLDSIYYTESDGDWLCSVDFNVDNPGDYSDKTIAKIREQIKDKEATTISAELFHEKYNTIFEGTFEDKTEFLGGCMTLLYYDKVNKLYATNFLIPFSGCEPEPHVSVLKGVTQENGNLTIETGLTIASEKEKAIDYTFKFDQNTGNYIFVSRTVN